ncbi:hypothetical protein J2X69_001881 [Algoriphagus sp. 4150]|uniref:WG repeat-containing protein n=1 Tax=Algoriphagus sp. 4150 TaxID=2817756 RepID=UPI00285EA462|nr:WG repeat-containing protein [Algoriphagus sp. 4150]MDR7129536.1 hypothetical protein [Algoriphagus sp. 4150]
MADPNRLKVFITLLLPFLLLSLAACARQQEEVSGISTFVHGFARVEKDGQSFYIDTTGNYAFDYIYSLNDHTYEFGNRYTIEQYEWELKFGDDKTPKTLFSVFREKDNKWGILAPDGSWILKPEYNYDDQAFEAYRAVPVKGETSPPPKPPQFSQFEDYGILDGVHLDVKKGDKWGIYNRETKEIVIPMEYDEFDYCGGCGRKSDYVYAKKNGKWGIVSFDNKVLVPFEYDHHHWGMRSDEWVQSFQKNGGRLIVNIPTKKEYVEDEYGHFELLNNGALSLKKNGKYGLVNANGEEILPFEYDDIGNSGTRKGSFGMYGSTEYYGSWITVVKNGKGGLLDISGYWVLPLQFDVRPYYTFQIHGNYIIASENQKFNVYDEEGNKLFIESYDAIDPSYEYDQEGNELLFFVTKKGDLHGFYNTKSKVMVPPAFHDLYFIDKSNYIKDNKLIHNGLIEAQLDDKKGLYDFDGKEVLPVQYTAWRFFDSENFPNLVEIEQDEKVGLYDFHLEKEILRPTYGNLYHFDKDNHPNLLRVSNNGKNGLFDLADGKEVIAPEYEYFREFSAQKWVLVEEASLKGVIDFSGKIVVPALFRKISFLSDEIWLLQDNDEKYAVYESKTQRIKTIDYPFVWESDDPRALLVSEDSLTVQIYQTEKHQVLPQKYTKADVYGYDPIDFEYPILHSFFNGLARVDKKIGEKAKIGFINSDGEAIIPFEYDIASFGVKNGFVVVGKENKDYGFYSSYNYGYADSTGHIAVPLTYDYHNSITEYINEEHLLLISLDQTTNQYKIGLANHQGNILIKPEYNNVYPFENGNGILLANGKDYYSGGSYYVSNEDKEVVYGLADPNGKIVVPMELEEIKTDWPLYFEDFKVALTFPLLAKHKGKWKYYNRDGKVFPYRADEVIEFRK